MEREDRLGFRDAGERAEGLVRGFAHQSWLGSSEDLDERNVYH